MSVCPSGSYITAQNPPVFPISVIISLAENKALLVEEAMAQGVSLCRDRDYCYVTDLTSLFFVQPQPGPCCVVGQLHRMKTHP